MARFLQIFVVFIAINFNMIRAKQTHTSLSENISSAKSQNISKLNVVDVFFSFLNENINHINSFINPTTNPITSTTATTQTSSTTWATSTTATTATTSTTTTIPPPITTPEKCRKSNDLIILVDSTGGLERDQYFKLLNFTAALASDRRLITYPISGVGVYTFSFETFKTFNISQSYAMAAWEIRSKVFAAENFGEPRRTDIALGRAILELHGMHLRTRSILVITTGRSYIPQFTQQYADQAPRYGIRVVAAGIGNTDEHLDKELELITGGVKSHIFRSKEFENISDLLGPVSRILCW